MLQNITATKEFVNSALWIDGNVDQGLLFQQAMTK